VQSLIAIMYWLIDTLIPMKKEYYTELYELFSRLKTSEEAKLFLGDMLTPHELDQVAERWQLVKRLSKGMPQRKIKDELGISIEKVTRGSKELQKGKGGFQLFL
jgi:TrpR family transcriptional regulator, trp operon repressor